MRSVRKPSLQFIETKDREEGDLDEVPGTVSGLECHWQLEEISLSQSLCHQECLKLSCTQWEMGALRRGRWSSVRRLGSRSFNSTWNHPHSSFVTQPLRFCSELACSFLPWKHTYCRERNPSLPLDNPSNLVSQAMEEQNQRHTSVWFPKSVSGQLAGRASTLLKKKKKKSLFFFLLCIFCWFRITHTVLPRIRGNYISHHF